MKNKTCPYKNNMLLKIFCPNCKQITEANVLDECVCEEENGGDIYYGVTIKILCKKCNKIVYKDKEERGYFL
ncbi:MAG: hypothetical protein II598_03425 [Elusimicrobia bacterium]|nr:hypothetical protein [Elusimicrobiota bacterium]